MFRPTHAPLACLASALLLGSACSGTSSEDADATETEAGSSGTLAGSSGNTTPGSPDTDASDESSGESDDSSTGGPPLPCGDGELDPATEACDDGNDIDLDGCNTNCTVTGALLWESAIVPSLEIEGVTREAFTTRVEAVAPTPDGEGVLVVGTATFEITSTDWVGSFFIMRFSSGGEIEWERHDQGFAGLTLDPWTLRATTLKDGLVVEWSGDDIRTRVLFDPENGSDLWVHQEGGVVGLTSLVETDDAVYVSGNRTEMDAEPAGFLAKLDGDGLIGPDLLTGPAETFFSGVAPMQDGRFAVVGRIETSNFGNPGQLQVVDENFETVWSVEFGGGAARVVALEDGTLLVHRSSGTFDLTGASSTYNTRTTHYSADGEQLWEAALGRASTLDFAVDAFGSSVATLEEVSASGSGLDAYSLRKLDAQGNAVWEVQGNTGEGYEVFTTVETLPDGAVALGGFRQNQYDRDAFVRLYAR